VKTRTPSAPAVVVAIMTGFIFITIPSIILVISSFVLWPIGWFLSVFTGKPSALRAHFITLKLSPIFLILVIPAIFYFYVWVPLCWIFFGWTFLFPLLEEIVAEKNNCVICIYPTKQLAEDCDSLRAKLKREVKDTED